MRPIFIKLREKELKDMKRFMTETAYRKNFRARLRGNAIWMSSEQHMSVTKIASSLEHSPKTIYNWFRRFNEQGIDGLYDSAKSVELRLTPKQIEQVIKLSGWEDYFNGSRRIQKPWSYRKIAKWVKEQWGITISHERIRQIIQEKLSGDP